MNNQVFYVRMNDKKSVFMLDNHRYEIFKKKLDDGEKYFTFMNHNSKTNQMEETNICLNNVISFGNDVPVIPPNPEELPFFETLGEIVNKTFFLKYKRPWKDNMWVNSNSWNLIDNDFDKYEEILFDLVKNKVINGFLSFTIDRTLKPGKTDWRIKEDFAYFANITVKLNVSTYYRSYSFIIRDYDPEGLDKEVC